MLSKLTTFAALCGAFFIAIGIAVLKGRAEGVRHMEAEQQGNAMRSNSTMIRSTLGLLILAPPSAAAGRWGQRCRRIAVALDRHYSKLAVCAGK